MTSLKSGPLGRSPVPSGVLSDIDIQREIASRTPPLVEGYKTESIRASCYDLTIGHVINKRIGVAGEGSGLQQLLPGEVATVVSREILHLPLDITGLVIPRDGPAQNGLLILNAGHVDPGFDGFITAQVVNLNFGPIELSVGGGVFSVIFEYLNSETSLGRTSRGDADARLQKMYGNMLQRQSLLNMADLQARFVAKEELTGELLRRIWLWGPVPVTILAFLAALGLLIFNLVNFQAHLFQLIPSIQTLPPPSIPSPSPATAG